MSRTNAMSTLGRMGWGTHMLVYPTAVAAYFGVYAPYKAKQEKDQQQADADAMAKAAKVDPDYFNPFSAIPFHNNPELKYVFAEINMRHYVND